MLVLFISRELATFNPWPMWLRLVFALYSFCQLRSGIHMVWISGSYSLVGLERGTEWP
jgi:hypothetical protein